MYFLYRPLVLVSIYILKANSKIQVHVFYSDGSPQDRRGNDFGHIQTVKVKKVLVHWQYDNDTEANDIAMLKLEKRIDFSQYEGTVRAGSV